MEQADTMSDLIARLERAFFALRNPAPPALPAPDRQPEIDELRAKLAASIAEGEATLARLVGAERALELNKKALASANADIESLGVRTVELSQQVAALEQERDEARRTVGDRDDLIETLRAEIDAANQADQAAGSAGPDPAAVDAAALEAQKAVGGSLEYVAAERMVEYARKLVALIHSSPNIVEGTENATPSV
jgi:chromosome segregation ATPase